MRMLLLIPMLSALALTAVAIISMARGAEVAAGDLVVTQAWARATPPGAPTAAAYVTVENRGSTEDKLIGATTPAAKSAMLHETIEENGVSMMREADATVAPGGSLAMRPGGMHIMLMGLNGSLKAGDTISMKLEFEKAGVMTVDAKVAPIGATTPQE